jgi:hypothetical protein
MYYFVKMQKGVICEGEGCASGYGTADMPIGATYRKPAKKAPSLEKACALADETGIGQEFRFILEESRRLGLSGCQSKVKK